MPSILFTLHDDPLFGLRAIVAYLHANHINGQISIVQKDADVQTLRLTLDRPKACSAFAEWFNEYAVACHAPDEATTSLMQHADALTLHEPGSLLPNDWATRSLDPFEDWLDENDPEGLDEDNDDPRSVVLHDWAKTTKHWDGQDARCRYCNARLDGFWNCTRDCR